MKTLMVLVITTLVFVGNVHASDKSVRVYAADCLWKEMTIELTRDFYQQYGIKVEVVSLPWKRAVKYIESGQLDMILTIFETAGRSEEMIFTSPFIEVPTVVIVNNGHLINFTGAKDLIGQKGLMIRGASLGNTFDEISGKLHIEEIANEYQVISMLNYGRADYAIGAKYAFLFEAQKMGVLDKLVVLEPPLALGCLRMAYSKNSRFVEYLDRLNQMLDKLKMEGVLEKKAIQLIESVKPESNEPSSK